MSHVDFFGFRVASFRLCPVLSPAPLFPFQAHFSLVDQDGPPFRCHILDDLGGFSGSGNFFPGREGKKDPDRVETGMKIFFK